MSRKHLLIGDTQQKPGVDSTFLRAVGRSIIHEQPDVIVHIGDHFDMPSLSSYDYGKKCYEGRRIQEDINAGHEAMRNLLYPLAKLQKKQRKLKHRVYRPEMHFCLGNHEERLGRHIESHAELEGMLNYPDSFDLHLYGWNVHAFRQPVEIDGFAYAHYFYHPNSGKPIGGAGLNKLKNIGQSFCAGHVQGLDLATRTTNLGHQQWGITNGSCYEHDEGYKGPQANEHWRGVVYLDRVERGNCDPRPVSLKSIKENYS